ncbi:MAG TPA: CRISPR-associated helicase Cas3' [Oscillospiraceae bacterium]|nr:CRISPR-associated helicase Cas3' [Oscillospiraceae bacterium]HPS36025.1 CRISPR-associated helicase Cas3' [Oscillospiraceae bacterium]
MDNHPAHIRNEENGERTVQTLTLHSRNVARYCADHLSALSLCHLGYLTGLIHDFGKATNKFADYIERAAAGENVMRGSVNHTFAGVKYIFSLFHGKGDEISDAVSELIAYAVGAHHGLFDCVSAEGKDGFLHRLEKDEDEISYDEAVSEFLKECSTTAEIETLFEEAKNEVKAVWEIIRKISRLKATSATYYKGMTERMLLSALIDADRRDTAEFILGEKRPENVEMSPIWNSALKHLEGKLSEIVLTGDIEIYEARKYISESCKNFPAKNGVYRLTVPTGSGKTLSALRFALTRAAGDKHLKRIIYAAPLLSILEQNASVIREYIGNDEIVLEHHSDIIDETKMESKSQDEKDQYKQRQYDLLCEDWHAPVIITTFVQLLNTLFEGRTSCIRRMNSLCESVIIIDEIQSLPLKLISMMNEAFNFLTGVCGAIVVLCSATQPCFAETAHPLQLAEQPDIVPFDEKLWRVFERTRIVDKCKSDGYATEEMAAFVIDAMVGCDSLLFICNTKNAAYDLFKLLEIKNKNTEEPFLLFHLSAAMCPQHRIDTLKAIKSNLCKRHVVCISTQLVEAGVDISFQCVVRVMAGLDNIAQAAGRCNRSGEYPEACNVYVVNAKDEHLGPLAEIRHAQDAADNFLYSFSKIPEQFGNSILSEKSVSYYYHCLYKDPNVKKVFDYPVSHLNTSIYEMLSKNERFVGQAHEPVCTFLKQAFKTAGENFEVFGEKTTDVIVPYNERANTLIADLYSKKAETDLKYLKEKLHAAKPYTVSLYDFHRRQLEDAGGIYAVEGKPFITVQPGFYDRNTGVGIDMILYQ